MSRYACVVDQKAAGFPVTTACEIADVSTSGFYDWCQRETAEPTDREIAEADLVALIREIFDARSTWRSPPAPVTLPVSSLTPIADRNTPRTTTSITANDTSYDPPSDGWRRVSINALAESTIGLYKAECIHFDGPWRNVDEVELATLNWVWWFNEIRLHSAIGTSRQSNTRTPTTVHTTTPNSTCCRENPPSTKLARFIQSRRPQRKPHPRIEGMIEHHRVH